jgi:hypothetical protein
MEGRVGFQAAGRCASLLSAREVYDFKRFQAKWKQHCAYADPVMLLVDTSELMQSVLHVKQDGGLNAAACMKRFVESQLRVVLGSQP